MSEVSGIELEKDAAGNNSYVRIDLKKYGDMINPILKQLGVIGQTQFDKDWGKSTRPGDIPERSENTIKRVIQSKT